MKIKLILLSILCSIGVIAQTNTPPPTPDTIGGKIDAITGGLSVLTNWSAYPYFTYAPDSPKKYGGGILAIYNVNNNFGAGLGVDELGGKFNMISGDVTLKIPTHPLAFLGATNFSAIPFGIAGIGTPLSGAGTANGNISTIAGAGVAFDIFQWKGFQASVGYEYSIWTGASDFSGAHHHIFLGVRKGF